MVKRAKVQGITARRDTVPRDITFEDAAKLDPDEHPAELVEGRLVPVSRGTWRHGRITGNVYLAPRLYANAHGGWVVATADRVVGRDDALDGSDVLPGFACRVADLFV